MPDPLEWTTRDSRVAYTCPGFDVRHDDVTLPDGTETDFDYVDEPPAVVILPFTGADEVVTIEEWRQAVGRVNQGFPAGTVEPEDDDPAEAAARELTEETGYVADDLEHLVTVEPANGVTNALHHVFAATGCTQGGAQALDFNESIRVTVRPTKDVFDAVDAGEIRDGRTVLAVLTYRQTHPDL